MPFDIKTSAYEGPLDLLIALIEKREVFINDISLAQVTEDYIEYINSLEERDIDNMSEFVLVASTLVLIKSKSLLPKLDLSPEEQESIDDLETRVKKYRLIKSLTEKIIEISSGGESFPRGEMKKQFISFAPSKDMSVENLLTEAKYLIENLPKPEPKKPKVMVEKTISLNDVIDDLKNRIQSNFKMSFNEYSSKSSTKDKAEKVNVIISFLALLELVKQGTVRAEQDEDFKDISIETDSLGVPTY